MMTDKSQNKVLGLSSTGYGIASVNAPCLIFAMVDWYHVSVVECGDRQAAMVATVSVSERIHRTHSWRTSCILERIGDYGLWLLWL